MEPNNQPTLDLEALIRAYLEDLREIAQPASAGGDELPTRGAEELRQATEHMIGQRATAVVDINERYGERTEALRAVVVERQIRLEAYAQRQRQHVPSEPNTFIAAGRVTDKATGNGLPYVRVRAVDGNGQPDERLGETRTDALGYYRLEYSFAEDGEEGPETFIEVQAEDGQPLFTSSKSFSQRPETSEFIPAAVDGERLPTSRRLGEKVVRTVDGRKRELVRRGVVLEHRPDVTMEAAGPRVSRGGPPPSTGGGKMPPMAPREAPAVRKGRKQTKPAKPHPLTDVKGVGKVYRQRLEKAGFHDAASVAAADPESLRDILQVGETRARKIVAAAKRTAKKS